MVSNLSLSPLYTLPPPHTSTPFGQFEAAAVDLEDGSNLEVESVTADIGQQ
jgi:hypothetical protein